MPQTCITSPILILKKIPVSSQWMEAQRQGTSLDCLPKRSNADLISISAPGKTYIQKEI